MSATISNKRLSLIALVLAFIIYPYFFLGLMTPEMVPASGALMDANTGPLTFMPGIKTIRYELFEHHQLLWSSLRGLGMPLLGNDVQAAPLFPLTLLWIWLPDAYFWHFFVISKIVLMGLGALLIGTRVFYLSQKSSIAFCLTLVYSTYFMGWINHPLQAAFLAGLWHFYFSARVLASENWKESLGSLCGVAFATYGLVSSGFPGGMVIAGFTSALILFPLIVTRVRRLRSSAGALGFWVLAHVVALLMSAHLVLALLEYVRSAGADFRNHIGLTQMQSAGFFFDLIFRFGHEVPPVPMKTVFRLVPLFFFIIGLFGTITKKRKATWVDAGVVLCLVAYVFKIFPLWPALNNFVGSLPVLKQIKFIAYSFAMPIWFFAFYVAQGVDLSFSSSKKFSPLQITTLAGSLTGVLFFYSWYRRAVAGAEIAPQRFLLLLPIVVLGYFVYRSRGNLERLSQRALYVLMALFYFELMFTNPSNFMKTGQEEYRSAVDANERGLQITKELLRNGYSPLEWRSREPLGLMSGGGLATFDNGGTAIYPERMLLFRNTMFDCDWEGYMPCRAPKLPYSYKLTSSAIAFSSEGPQYKLLESASGQNLWVQEGVLPRAYLATRCFSSFSMQESARQIQDKTIFRLGDVWIENLSAEGEALCNQVSSWTTETQSPKIISDTGDSVKVSKILGPALLILGDNIFPGWRAYDVATQDALTIYEANISQRAVFLKEKRPYEVVFQYRPAWLRTAHGLASAGWLLFLACVAYVIRKFSGVR